MAPRTSRILVAAPSAPEAARRLVQRTLDRVAVPGDDVFVVLCTTTTDNRLIGLAYDCLQRWLGALFDAKLGVAVKLHVLPVERSSRPERKCKLVAKRLCKAADAFACRAMAVGGRPSAAPPPRQSDSGASRTAMNTTDLVLRYSSLPVFLANHNRMAVPLRQGMQQGVQQQHSPSKRSRLRADLNKPQPASEQQSTAATASLPCRGDEHGCTPPVPSHADAPSVSGAHEAFLNSNQASSWDLVPVGDRPRVAGTSNPAPALPHGVGESSTPPTPAVPRGRSDGSAAGSRADDRPMQQRHLNVSSPSDCSLWTPAYCSAAGPIWKWLAGAAFASEPADLVVR